ncbi:nucleoside hydrolase, partial [Glutamicibacter protophormiae]|uniref:nucleoside hydrolase n=1 Tax=Glutamicibacter protophormiae TaxID=37930 RepID=UPI003A911EEB
GLGGYELPASGRMLEPGIPLLARLIEDSAEPVTVVAIGPLTDIALLMNEHPTTARKIERLVIMGGGTLDVPGNVTAAAEFNIYYDPDAAARVFDFGVPITMVGLNVTHRALVGSGHLTRLLASGGPISHMVAHIVGGYRDSYSEEEAMAQHDSLAVAAALDVGILGTRHLHVDVENVGRLTAGMTVVDYRIDAPAGNCDVAVDIDVELFRDLLDTRLTALDQTLKR